MKNNLIKVAAAAPRLKVGDVRHNAEEIIKIIRENEDCGLIVFPELCITGYTCAAVVGLPVRFGNALYNCGAILSQGEVKALIPKAYLPNYSEFYECRWFASGRDLRGESIRIGEKEIPFGMDVLAEDYDGGAVLGVEICEDLWVPDKPSTHAALAGANLIANPSASDELIGKQEYRRELVKQQSGACYCGYVYASAGTDESSTDLVFSGHAIIAQNGGILKESIFPEGSQVTKFWLILE